MRRYVHCNQDGNSPLAQHGACDCGCSAGSVHETTGLFAWSYTLADWTCRSLLIHARCIQGPGTMQPEYISASSEAG
eukprot:3565478-Alexandrium_andersonii.AAC.1